MLPILILPDDWRLWAVDDAAAIDLCPRHRRAQRRSGESDRVGVRWKDRRGNGRSVEFVIGLLRSDDALKSTHRPASLADGERFVNLAARRRRNALGRRESKQCKQLAIGWKQRRAAIREISCDTIAWLLWTMSWLGVSSPRQVFEPRTHPPTLLVRLMTSLPEWARTMDANATLRLLWSVLERTFLYWRLMTSRMHARGRFILDHHLMPVRFSVRELASGARLPAIGKLSSHEARRIIRLADRNLKSWYPGTRG